MVVRFAAGAVGEWRIEYVAPVQGEVLPSAGFLAVTTGPEVASAPQAVWCLRGHTSNLRYTTRAEADAMATMQEELGRPTSTRAALIPIRKSAAWWAMAQDERRAVFEEQSHHIAIGMEYLPAVARRLHHSRELGEPFDFLTWFEYAPEESERFEEMVRRLRERPEWRFVEREVDVRLVRV